jgi:pimeloyl-ACP methyl ester carboxylesterase
MTLPRVLSWRSLRIAALSVVVLVGLLVTGLALWGLPAPPALTVEQGPRVSWTWAWQGMQFVTFLQASEDGHFPEAQRAEFGDERDPAMRAFLESISPARHAERIRVPLLIFQGANDVRVKAQQSRQMVERSRAADGTVTYVEAADEGHNIEQPLNQLYFGSLMSEFTARCLAR